MEAYQYFHRRKVASLFALVFLAATPSFGLISPRAFVHDCISGTSMPPLLAVYNWHNEKAFNTKHSTDRIEEERTNLDPFVKEV